jgi:hypothetical protein
MKEWLWQEELKDKWIYESPDGGSTVTRRPFLGEVEDRMIIRENGVELKEPKRYDPWGLLNKN